MSAEYVYDHTYAVTGTFFQLTGTPDAVIYSANPNMSPNSRGFIADVAYLPFSHGAPGPWPFLNTRLGVSYTYYTSLSGEGNYDSLATTGFPAARDSNVVLLYAFTAF